MSWNDVGDFLKGNAGKGVALIGSLLTGNVPGAIAAGMSLVASATGTDDPAEAMKVLQMDPAAMIRLKELAIQEGTSIRAHTAEMFRLELEDGQRSHTETQATIRSGDNAEDVFVRRVRPGQSCVSLAGALWYAFTINPSPTILGLLLTLPFAYAGLREVGKGSFGKLFKN